jgi:tetratricopeptide (TPR) repeat protein
MGNSALAIVDLTNAINAHSSEPYGYPDGYAARAEAYGASGDDTREIADWQKVIRATSRHEFIDRMLLSAAVGIGRGQYTRAITICELIMVRESFNLNALLLRAEAFNATSQFDRAIADLTTAIKFDPQDDELFFTRGKTFLTKGDQNGAIADFGTAISLEPNEPAYRIARARIFQMTGHLDEANKDFGEAGRLQSARIGR